MNIGALGMQPPTWAAAAACAADDVDPELFFPYDSDHAGAAAAKAVCETCPVRRQCLAWALTNPVHGVWGGTTPAERAALQRTHGLPRKALFTSSESEHRDDD